MNSLWLTSSTYSITFGKEANYPLKIYILLVYIVPGGNDWALWSMEYKQIGWAPFQAWIAKLLEHDCPSLSTHLLIWCLSGSTIATNWKISELPRLVSGWKWTEPLPLLHLLLRVWLYFMWGRNNFLLY